ncbi:MAG: FG-GAP-like repeat-containing protein [bacterium]
MKSGNFCLPLLLLSLNIPNESPSQFSREQTKGPSEPNAQAIVRSKTNEKGFVETEGKGILNSAILLAALPGEYNPDPNTVLLLHLNETSGSSVIDASGKVSSITAIGTTIIDGRFGKTRSFNGTSDYIQGTTNLFSFGVNDFTVEAWVKTSSTIRQAIFTTYGSEIGTYMVGGTNGGSFDLDINNSQGSTINTSGRKINDGKWHHVAAIRTGTKALLYVDGFLDFTETLTQNPNASTSFLLGANGTAYFKGLIDEVRISNIARKPEEFNVLLPPTNLVIASAGGNVALSWKNGGGGIGVLRYKLYRGLDSLTVTAFDSTSTTSYAYSPGATKYYYRVSAVDSSGFEGSMTYAVTPTTTLIIPSITSFTPTSGPIGTMVTITGTNFNTTLSNNVVYFGGVKAKVNSAASTTLVVVVPSGATYAPIMVTDLSTNLTAFSAKPFTVTFSSNRVIDANSFDRKVDFTVGTKPNCITIGDVDGDGKSDLIVSNWSGNTISIFRNTSTSGSISSTSFAGKVDFTLSGGPANSALGDFDGDGKLDLAVPNTTANTLSIFRNTSSIGSFSSSSFAVKVDFPLGSGPSRVAIHDLDGDGKPDIVATNANSNTISIYRNTSTTGSITSGSFAPKLDLATGTGPADVAIGDLDGDGKPDIVIANSLTNSVSIFPNKSTIGSITSSSFSSKVDLIIGSNPGGLALSDLDGDGKIDIVTSHSTSNTISVLRNTSTSGNLSSSSFAAKVDFITGSVPLDVVVCDLDGDGKPDLATTNNSSSSISVFQNTSSIGSITSTSFASKVDFVSGNAPATLSIGDLDGDGKPDLAIANDGSNSISLLRNALQPLASPPMITSFSPTSGSVGTSVTITGTNFSAIVSNNIVYFGAVKAAVTSATSTTLTVVVPTGVTYQPITVTTNGLTAYSTAPFVVTFTSSGMITNTSFAPRLDFTTGVSPSYNVIIDVDGDGKSDMVVPSQNNNVLSVFRNLSTSGTIGFATKVDFTTGIYPRDVAVGDLDGDGKPDLAVTNWNSNTVSIFRNTSVSGSVSFSTKTDFATGTAPLGIAIGDLDGDGKPDMVVANSSSNTISIFRNTSTAGSISFSTKLDIASGTYPCGVAIGDLDADGRPDVAVANYNSPTTISIYKNTSTAGNISLPSKFDLTTGNTPKYIAISDVDGDLKPDLTVTHQNSNNIAVFRNTSTSGSLTTSSFAAALFFVTGTNVSGISYGDIDGDSKPDAAVTNWGSNTVTLLKNTSTSGNVSFATKVDFGTGTNPYGVALGDIDGDGKLDLSVVNVNSNNISIYRNAMTIPSTISVHILSPNGAENWNEDSFHRIIWQASDNSAATINRIQLLYSYDKGASWKLIKDSLLNSGSYLWQVPRTPSKDVYVKVVGYNSLGASAIDTSTSALSIIDVQTFVHKTGLLNNTIRNDGIIGSGSATFADDEPSMEYPAGSKNHHLYLVQLMIGALKAVGDTLQTLDYEDSFLPMDPITSVARTGVIETKTRFLLKNNSDIQLSQSTLAPQNETFIIHIFKLYNKSGQTLNNLYLGPYADFDVNDPNKNLTGVDAAKRLIYTYDASNTWKSYAGICMVSAAPSSIQRWGGTANPAPRNTLSWYKALSRTGYDSPTSDPIADYRVGEFSGPFSLTPGDSATIAFALAAGDGLSGVQAVSQRAQAFWDALLPTPAPIVITSAASLVTTTTAQLNALVNPNNQNGTGWFEYGTSSTLATYRRCRKNRF